MSKRVLSYAAIVLGLIGVFIAGYVAGSTREFPQFSSVLREDGYEFINPVLLCNTNINNAANEDTALSKKIAQYAASAKEKDIGVYYLKLGDYRWAGTNVSEAFSPASMLKVPTAAAILRYADSHPDILQKKVTYSGAWNENGAEYFKPKETLAARTSYTADDLIRYSIAYSENNAERLLETAVIDEKHLNNIYVDLGIQLPENIVDFMSPQTYSLFLRLLYNSTYLSREMSEKLLGLMTTPDFPQGIESGVPDGVKVAAKFGERQIFDQNGTLLERELHDCGIVYARDPYILCVMTRGKDFEVLAREIAEISKLVYEEQ